MQAPDPELHSPTDARYVPLRKAGHLPRDVLQMALGRPATRAERGEFVVVSFLDSARDEDARGECFNCCTAYLGGKINHVEISFTSNNSTAGVTLDRGSFSTVNKPFRSIYVHLVLRVGHEGESAMRASTNMRLERQYDVWGLFDCFLCGMACFSDPDKETCARMVIRALRAGGVLPDDVGVETPQQLYFYLMSDDVRQRYESYFVDFENVEEPVQRLS